MGRARATPYLTTPVSSPPDLVRVRVQVDLRREFTLLCPPSRVTEAVQTAITESTLSEWALHDIAVVSETSLHTS